MKILIAGIIAGSVMLSASAAQAQPRFTCEQVRWAAKEFGRRALEVMAKTYGATPEEIAFGRKCLARKGQD